MECWSNGLGTVGDGYDFFFNIYNNLGIGIKRRPRERRPQDKII